MPRVAPVVPDETDLLCEGCGYTLNGLPTPSNFPECGKPIEQSVGDHRHPSAFEQHPSAASFLSTSAAVILRPKHFYRTLTSRSNPPAAATFARIHRYLASVLLGAAALGHLRWVLAMLQGTRLSSPLALLMMLLGFAVMTNLFLLGLTKLAAWLSAIEAKYWGMRLPYRVV